MGWGSFSIDLSGRTVVITGAGGVMCSRFSRTAARAGARVALLDINLPAAQAVARELTEEGCQARAYQADVLDPKALEAARSRVLAELGPCDALINGAGGNHPRGNTEDEILGPDGPVEGVKSFYQLDRDGFQMVLDLNLVGTLLPTQVFTRDMLGRGGAVVNISSMNAIKPLTKLPAYSAAKAAISNFTEWLAVYFSRSGIRVNAIAPGFFITNQNRANLVAPDGGYTARAHKILERTPMGRFGRIEELCGLLLFLLCEEASSFLTGAVIPVDGGFQAYCGI